MFKWPNVFDIWNTYLTKFIQRYVSLVSSVGNNFYVTLLFGHFSLLSYFQDQEYLLT